MSGKGIIDRCRGILAGLICQGLRRAQGACFPFQMELWLWGRFGETSSRSRTSAVDSEWINLLRSGHCPMVHVNLLMKLGDCAIPMKAMALENLPVGSLVYGLLLSVEDAELGRRLVPVHAYGVVVVFGKTRGLLSTAMSLHLKPEMNTDWVDSSSSISVRANYGSVDRRG